MVDFTNDLMRDFTNWRIFNDPKVFSGLKRRGFKKTPVWIIKNSFLDH
jgi:hypothetical protein